MPRPKDKDDVLRLADAEKIRFVLLQFTDILGTLKSVAIPVERLPQALDGQIMFDGSSVHGFARIEESDMFLMPDPRTYVSFSWRDTDRGNTARLICDIYDPDGRPFEGCVRHALKRVMAEARDMGYVMNAGPEAEFFLFHCDDAGRPSLHTHDQGSYFDMSPIDKGKDIRRDMLIALQDVGMEVEASHHEVAPAQHEIGFRYADALDTADNIVTFKTVIRSIANINGLHVTFMPKPITGINGSGMHIHQSLFAGAENVFFDPAAQDQLSEICHYYMGGQLEHARGFTAITNPLVNSYKRLVPGYEAPVFIAWSERNRSPLIRVPARRGVGTRVELRSPDPSCNPYLAMAVTLKAGLDGIERKISSPEPCNLNIYELSEEDRRRYGIGSLPGNLEEALDELLKDEVIQQALGEHILERFVDAKQMEADVYATQVHPWELDQYLAVY